MNQWYSPQCVEFVYEKFDKYLCLVAEFKNLELDISEHEIFEHYKYVLQILLPFLQQLNEEQMAEKQLEAERQGIFY